MRIFVALLLSCACCALNLPGVGRGCDLRDAHSGLPEVSERSQPVMCPLLRSGEWAGWWMPPTAISIAAAAVRPHDACSAESEARALADFVLAGTLQSLAVRLQI